jgi:hypothetical protein
MQLCTQKSRQRNYSFNRHHPGHNQVNNEYQKLMPHFLQQLLDIIGKWCTDYGMSPGFSKCNYISDKNINLKLLDNLLDRTECSNISN